MSMVRDAAAVARVLADDPVAGCMVAARVAEHGIEPAAIGGELWTRRRARTRCVTRAPISFKLRGGPADMKAFAEQALSAARRCSSWWAAPTWCWRCGNGWNAAWGPARDVQALQPLMACDRARGAWRIQASAGSGSRKWTPIWWPPSTCSSARWASTRAPATAARATAGGWPT